MSEKEEKNKEKDPEKEKDKEQESDREKESRQEKGQKRRSIKITDEQDKLLRKIARAIASKGMTPPTIFFLESMQPLNYIGSQFMAYLEPFLTFFIPRDAYNDIQKILEQRKGIDYFLTIMEEVEYEKQQHDKKVRKDIKNLKKMEKVAKEERKTLKERDKKQKK